MKYLIELDHVKNAAPLTRQAGREFVEEVIFPTMARAEQLAREGSIVAGGPVAGRIALRFIAEADSPQQVDALVSSLPLWPVAETRVTPLVEFGERRAHVEALRQRLVERGDKRP
jgi:muconolactone delta-isomerase